MNDTRRNDRDDIAKDARRMQDIMQRNNIPTDVPYDRIATQPGYNNGGYPDNGYNNGSNDNRYSRGDAGYGQTRLSPDDHANSIKPTKNGKTHPQARP